MLYLEIIFGKNNSQNPLTLYSNDLCIVRDPYFGKTFEGNECKRIITEKNLHKLSGLLRDGHVPEVIAAKFIKCFTNIRIVFTTCCERKELDRNHRAIIGEFKDSFQSLTDEPQVKLTWSNKVHIIVDHISDYFDLTGETLFETSDQNVESMHAFMMRTFQSSKYWIKDPTSDKCAEMQQKGVNKINSYSVNTK